MSTNKKKRIVVIGGVAAGTSAASKAKRIDPSADVKIIQEESVVSYGACGIPYVIEGIVNNFEELVERPADVFKSKYGIDIIINTRAYKIDRFRKQVHTTDLRSGKETIFDYDSLVVSTGASDRASTIPIGQFVSLSFLLDKLYNTFISNSILLGMW